MSDGRCVAWDDTIHAEGVVIDAELDRTPPMMLGRRFGTADFWGRWTRTECAAKLAGVPIAVWLRERGLDAVPPQAEVVTVRPQMLDPRLVVSVGLWVDRSARPVR